MARLDVTEVFANVRLPGHLHTESSLLFASNFEFQDTDVLLVTYPKSGTTWMQEILSLIRSNGDLEPIKSLPNWARAPWLEHTYFQEQLPHIGCPRLLTTHLPQPVLAPALKKAKPKVIYVARNPKDVAVSYYHFQRMAKFFPDPASFEDFLQDFMAGTVHYGSWFEHVKGWFSCREELGLFCITYEQLHQDLKGCVERLSAFLDHPVLPEQVGAILEHCSFAVMKENVMVNGTLVPPEIMDFQKGHFMRKGIVGDWRNHFCPHQSARFNEKYQQEMGGHPWPFQWDLD
ncbi:sulfotransferase 2B1-like [Erythrolamprus reginae]|uniref:sulfotransferase 2B1-like n=1 Tax=Erythrolamprus reginae TaxID=121349 RepID=UPI00396C4C07